MSGKVLGILAVLGIIIEFVCVITISWCANDIPAEWLGAAKASLMWDLTLFCLIGFLHKDSPMYIKRIWEEVMNGEEE